MSRARDNANLGAQAGSGLDASDLTTGALPVGVTGGSGLNALSASNLSAGTVPDARMPSLTGDITTVEGAVATTIAASVIGVKPHIIPDVLYPSSGNDLAGDALVATTDGPNGSTVASSKYGTVQASDGRMYYYTSIKGSKPIKDPRIGAHFGSQRHGFNSIQLLEQETATHGKNVYSVDGREWLRIVDVTGGGWVAENAESGCGINIASGYEGWIEVVGYFNAVNVIMRTYATRKSITPYINGVAGSTQNPSETAVSSPLLGRYVDAGSVAPLTISASLGINTLLIKDNIESSNYTNYHQGIELIAQDTSNVNNIQIPSQNVVSYGKKFTVSGTPHYDPFNGFTNSTSLHSAYVDTATSLGLSTGTLHGASWDKGGGDEIRPYNGGRVVKWVDSSGTIKTSVNMMPPNAQNSEETASAEITTPSATNTAYLPAFSDDAVDYSLAEVAKTFHWREFGNGAANGGTGSSTFADASMLSGSDSIAYVMDDGLTSFSAVDCEHPAFPPSHYNSIMPSWVDDWWCFTFIGTGIHYQSDGAWQGGGNPVFQNLSYGTHILKVQYINDHPMASGVITIDGVIFSPVIGSNYGFLRDEITVFQPKMPPIPEDAVVIADYMLMADHVVQTSSTAGHVSKGVRFCSGSRDHFYDAASAFAGGTSIETGHGAMGGFAGLRSPAGAVAQAKLPFFGTNFQAHVQVAQTAGYALTIGTTGKTETILQSASGDQADIITLADDQKVTLGSTLAHTTVAAADYQYMGCCVATPTHTSSHYQTFETPYLHELVGGDRNMEQTNLVVTPDGKTWDEVTRDVSYMSPNLCVSNITADSGNVTGAAVVIFDEHRGFSPSERRIDCYFKDFAYGYDRFICLVDGQYEFFFHTYTDTMNTENHYIEINSERISRAYTDGGQMYGYSVSMRAMGNLKRGDYVQLFGGHFANNDDLHTGFFITRLGER